MIGGAGSRRRQKVGTISNLALTLVRLPTVARLFGTTWQNIGGSQGQARSREQSSCSQCWRNRSVLLLVAGVAHAVRLARWGAGDRTVADRLVLVLHVGYAFVPIGFVLTGIAAIAPEW